MAPTISRRFNPAHVQISIGGTRVTGFGEDDIVTIEPVTAEAMTSTQSADGDAQAYGVNVDNRHRVTLMLSAHSAARARLHDLRRTQQEADSGVIAALNFRFYDPSNGDKVVSRLCMFMNRPGMAAKKGGRDADEFILELPNPRITRGPS